MYDFGFETATGIFSVTLRGFLAGAELKTYLARRAAAREDARRQAGRLLMLVDAREAPVQSADTVALVQSDWEDAVKGRTDRIAIVPSSALHVLQAKRTTQSDQIRVFTTLDEARQWLLAD